jgi:hypothetical protein
MPTQETFESGDTLEKANRVAESIDDLRMVNKSISQEFLTVLANSPDDAHQKLFMEFSKLEDDAEISAESLDVIEPVLTQIDELLIQFDSDHDLDGLGNAIDDDFYGASDGTPEQPGAKVNTAPEELSYGEKRAAFEKDKAKMFKDNGNGSYKITMWTADAVTVSRIQDFFGPKGLALKTEDEFKKATLTSGGVDYTYQEGTWATAAGDRLKIFGKPLDVKVTMKEPEVTPAPAADVPVAPAEVTPAAKANPFEGKDPEKVKLAFSKSLDQHEVDVKELTKLYETLQNIDYRDRESGRRYARLAEEFKVMAPAVMLKHEVIHNQYYDMVDFKILKLADKDQMFIRVNAANKSVHEAHAYYMGEKTEAMNPLQDGTHEDDETRDNRAEFKAAEYAEKNEVIAPGSYLEFKQDMADNLRDSRDLAQNQLALKATLEGEGTYRQLTRAHNKVTRQFRRVKKDYDDMKARFPEHKAAIDKIDAERNPWSTVPTENDRQLGHLKQVKGHLAAAKAQLASSYAQLVAMKTADTPASAPVEPVDATPAPPAPKKSATVSPTQPVEPPDLEAVDTADGIVEVKGRDKQTIFKDIAALSVDQNKTSGWGKEQTMPSENTYKQLYDDQGFIVARQVKMKGQTEWLQIPYISHIEQEIAVKFTHVALKPNNPSMYQPEPGSAAAKNRFRIGALKLRPVTASVPVAAPQTAQVAAKTAPVEPAQTPAPSPEPANPERTRTGLAAQMKLRDTWLQDKWDEKMPKLVEAVDGVDPKSTLSANPLGRNGRELVLSQTGKNNELFEHRPVIKIGFTGVALGEKDNYDATHDIYIQYDGTSYPSIEKAVSAAAGHFKKAIDTGKAKVPRNPKANLDTADLSPERIEYTDKGDPSEFKMRTIDGVGYGLKYKGTGQYMIENNLYVSDNKLMKSASAVTRANSATGETVLAFDPTHTKVVLEYSVGALYANITDINGETTQVLVYVVNPDDNQ